MTFPAAYWISHVQSSLIFFFTVYQYLTCAPSLAPDMASSAQIEPCCVRRWQERNATTLNDTIMVDALSLIFVSFEAALMHLYPAQRGTALKGRSRWRAAYWPRPGLH